MASWLVATLVVTGIVLFFLILFFLPDDAYGEEDTRTYAQSKIEARNRAHVLVLGDIGRSPRMQNHAISLAKLAVAVDLIGYVDSEVNPAIVRNKYITVRPLSRPPAFLETSNRTLTLVFAPLKALIQFWSLYKTLGLRAPAAKWLIVQNPPSIPTLMAATIVCWLRKTQLAIDWHNLGYAMLGLKLGPSHPLVRVSYLYERWFSRYATVNFAVSDAMRRQLRRDFGLEGPILRLYDRPTEDFRPASAEDRIAFLKDMDLSKEQHERLDSGRLKVVVSSTSWTPDEDFSILLDALTEYSRLTTTTTNTTTSTTKDGKTALPSLLVIITGKGPLKQSYMSQITRLEREGKLANVSIKTAWLPVAVYAMLLASADVGVSLHRSASGVDLPMKVVDMFGAGLPVVGWSAFEAWPELVKEGVNGRGFGTTAEELTSVLVQLLGDDGSRLQTLREGVLRERKRGWEEEWRDSAGRAMGLVDAEG